MADPGRQLLQNDTFGNFCSVLGKNNKITASELPFHFEARDETEKR